MSLALAQAALDLIATVAAFARTRVDPRENPRTGERGHVSNWLLWPTGARGGPAMDIDLNCDLGEGCPFDAELMPLITSASIACGFHAGDPSTAFEALRLAARHGVQAGAHPSFPDRESFGRREIERPPERIHEDCVYQIGALAGLARAAGIELRYVKARSEEHTSELQSLRH